MLSFQLKEEEEYIELHDLLKATGLCPTGGNAKTAISDGRVQVDGIVELRKRRKIRDGQVVNFAGRTIRIWKFASLEETGGK